MAQNIFDSPFFKGLTAAEAVQVLAEQIKYIKSDGIRSCVEPDCPQVIAHGTRCELHRKALAATLARHRYAIRVANRAAKPRDDQ
jgi:hypothetical protein